MDVRTCARGTDNMAPQRVTVTEPGGNEPGPRFAFKAMPVTPAAPAMTYQGRCVSGPPVVSAISSGASGAATHAIVRPRHRARR